MTTAPLPSGGKDFNKFKYHKRFGAALLGIKYRALKEDRDIIEKNVAGMSHFIKRNQMGTNLKRKLIRNITAAIVQSKKTMDRTRKIKIKEVVEAASNDPEKKAAKLSPHYLRARREQANSERINNAGTINSKNEPSQSISTRVKSFSTSQDLINKSSPLGTINQGGASAGPTVNKSSSTGHAPSLPPTNFPLGRI